MHDPRCMTLTSIEFPEVCDCRTLKLLDEGGCVRGRYVERVRGSAEGLVVFPREGTPPTVRRTPCVRPRLAGYPTEGSVMSGPVSDGQFVTEDGDVWCCEQCYNLASQSSELEST